MKQIKIDIANALGLRTITLGKVFPGWPPSTACDYPRTAFYQVGGTSGVADGKMACNDEVYSVDCFAKTMTQTEDMMSAVDAAMDSLPYIVLKVGNLDLYEQDTGVFHKVLRYRIKS